MNKEFRNDIVIYTGSILHFFAVALCVRCYYGVISFPLIIVWYLFSFIIGWPMFIFLAALIASILGFYSLDDFFPTPSSSSSSRPIKLYRPGESIRFHVENYTVSHYGERGDYLTVISAELCSQYGSRDVMGQGRGSTQEVAYMAARDDYEQNLESTKRR